MTHASTLPGRLPLPLYLAETEAVAAFDRSFATDVASQREDLEDSFDALEAAVFAPDRATWPADTFSLALVAWALSTIQAYAFNDAGVDVLVPIADKANHSPSARSHFEFGPDGVRLACRNTWAFRRRDSFLSSCSCLIAYRTPPTCL